MLLQNVFYPKNLESENTILLRTQSIVCATVFRVVWMYNFVVAHTLYLPHKTPNKFLFFRSTIYCQKSRIHQIGLFWQKTEIAHEFDLNFARTFLNSAPFSPSSDHQLNCAKILALASRTLGYSLGVVQKLREQFLSYFDF